MLSNVQTRRTLGGNPSRGKPERGEKATCCPEAEGPDKLCHHGPSRLGSQGLSLFWRYLTLEGSEGSRRAVLETSYHRAGHKEQPLPSHPCSHAIPSVQKGRLRHQGRNGHNSFIFPNSCEEVQSTSFRVSTIPFPSNATSELTDHLPEPVSSSAKW